MTVLYIEYKILSINKIELGKHFKEHVSKLQLSQIRDSGGDYCRMYLIRFFKITELIERGA